MQQSKPLVNQLREQLLRLQHLKQFPDLAEEILSAVESARRQMEFEEREYRLLQEKELVVNEKVVYKRSVWARQEQAEKQNSSFYNVAETPLYQQERRVSLKGMANTKGQISAVKNLYEVVVQKIKIFQRKIYHYIKDILKLQKLIIKSETRYAEITAEELHNIAVARFDKCFESVRYILESDERRRKAMERYE